MQRRPALDALCSIFFLALSALFAWNFVRRLFDEPCTLGTTACRVSDLLNVSDLLSASNVPHARHGVVSGGLAALFFAVALRLIWGIRHGE
jgi:hypothetical protein